jgi:hypothetical protein
MQSGHVYKVDSVDTADTQLWLSGDDVLICGDVMINKGEQGEKASVTLLLHRRRSLPNMKRVFLIGVIAAAFLGIGERAHMPARA